MDGDWHTAQDIFQETAARAWRHAGLLNTRGGHIRPWLFTVTRNLVIDHLRTRQIRPLEYRQRTWTPPGTARNPRSPPTWC
ncbi:sigma factor [Streptomyces sp. NPDC048442]|uniref:sigma factor n=1 Tax=Streptomyces sp. NPDC048442 TaxID=3154823 RepID=UPI00343FD07F